MRNRYFSSAAAVATLVLSFLPTVAFATNPESLCTWSEEIIHSEFCQELDQSYQQADVYNLGMPRPDAFREMILHFRNALELQPRSASVIDYDLPITENRFFIFEVQSISPKGIPKLRLKERSLIGHGRYSDRNAREFIAMDRGTRIDENFLVQLLKSAGVADLFSDVLNSYQTSLGPILTEGKVFSWSPKKEINPYTTERLIIRGIGKNNQNLKSPREIFFHGSYGLADFSKAADAVGLKNLIKNSEEIYSMGTFQRTEIEMALKIAALNATSFGCFTIPDEPNIAANQPKFVGNAKRILRMIEDNGFVLSFSEQMDYLEI